MKWMAITSPIFLISAIIMFCLSFKSIIEMHHLLGKSVVVNAVVSETGYNENTQGGQIPYSLITYVDHNQRRKEFKSTAIFDSSFSVPQPVLLRMKPAYPEKARLSSDYNRSTAFIILGVLAGLPCMFIGIVFFFQGFSAPIARFKARRYSRIVTAEITGVIRDTTIQLNHRLPYRIIAKWKNPNSKRVKKHTFESELIWFDPTKFCKDTILVKTDPKNIKKYWVDISFLPKIK
ncbi:hypothetical protein CHISP_1206 [Chitinispirillum alkaliphilum]|nr:hypothetical protein CHISP_1206 [Chitinispirillum alkaliphilum]